MKKSELAERAGLSRGYVGNIINQTAPTQSGQYNLSPETVRSLARALNLPEREILTAMDYLPSTGQIPEPIREALEQARDQLSERDIYEIANFIKFKAETSPAETEQPRRRMTEITVHGELDDGESASSPAKSKKKKKKTKRHLAA